MACSKGEDHLKEREKKEAIKREIEKKDREIDVKLTNIHLKLEMEILKAKNSTTKWIVSFCCYL